MSRPDMPGAAGAATAADESTAGSGANHMGDMCGCGTITCACGLRAVSAQGQGCTAAAPSSVMILMNDVHGQSRMLKVGPPWMVDQLYVEAGHGDMHFVCGGRVMQRGVPLSHYGAVTNKPFTTVSMMLHLRGGMHHASSLRVVSGAGAFKTSARDAGACNLHVQGARPSAAAASELDPFAGILCVREDTVAVRCDNQAPAEYMQWRVAAQVVSKWSACEQRDTARVCAFLDTLFVRQPGQSDEYLHATLQTVMRRAALE